ncbi:MAG TPA: sigma-70 family RNA polymerase sigma factor [Anaerolineales bacterium]|nr:sigma-70 family RNA polymerase sigma factor [Anaerolineales bacterium]
MRSHLDTEETLIRRLLPVSNPCERDRAYAWEAWQEDGGASALRRFIRMQNNTVESDEDIFQEAVATAYQEVERGRYQPQLGVPFTAYVKGIARNKIREARRKTQRWGTVPLEVVEFSLADAPFKQPEAAFERRQERAHFYRGLSTLPDGRKQVLERVVRGEGTAEIAAAMQISEDLVRQHKSRGLRVLREMLIPESA